MDYKFVPMLDFRQVRIIPAASTTVESRAKCDTSITLSGMNLTVPFIIPPMHSLYSDNLARNVAAVGAAAVVPRPKHGIFNITGYGDNLILNSSMDQAMELAQAMRDFSDAKHKILSIEIANGHMRLLTDKVKEVKDKFPDIKVWAGTVITPEAVDNLINAGADVALIGIGVGCLAGNTRILMFDGTYKNIQDVQVGEYVISGNGKPTRVVGKQFSGYKRVIKLRHTNGQDIYVTPEHQFLVGTFGDLSTSTVSSLGFKKSIREIVWDRADTENNILLSPRRIEFKSNFRPILFEDYWKRFDENGYSQSIGASYELGYVFGTFLGDGNSHISKSRNSQSGSVHWAFGLHEMPIAEKLANCVKVVFGKRPTIKILDNTIQVDFYCKGAAHLFSEFGKRGEKHLPGKYYCTFKEYNIGLYDGLIDSDGCVGIENGVERISLMNTSKFIHELFDFLCLSLFEELPAITEHIGGGTYKFNSIPYQSRRYISPDNRRDENWIYSKRLSVEEIDLILPTFDIQVEDESHSFIANNVVVHNSACTTTPMTGVGLPAFATVMLCAPAGPVILTGGLREPGDIAKAIGMGAEAVYIGALVKGASDTNSPTRYWGEASELEKENNSHIEGKIEALQPKTQTSADIIHALREHLQSAMSYSDAFTINEFRNKCQFAEVR